MGAVNPKVLSESCVDCFSAEVYLEGRLCALPVHTFCADPSGHFDKTLLDGYPVCYLVFLAESTGGFHAEHLGDLPRRVRPRPVVQQRPPSGEAQPNLFGF